MRYREFGATGLKVSEIGIGAYPISGLQTRPDGSKTGWTGVEDRESVALIHRAEELGVNLIDSAEGYGAGHSESVVGEALQGARRQKWIVATKVQPNQGLDKEKADEAAAKRRILEACEASLKRLRMEAIDLYQLHAIPHAWASETVMGALAQLKQEGKVRFYGISTNDQAAIERLRSFGPVEVLQIGYNLLERSADALLTWAQRERTEAILSSGIDRLVSGRRETGVLRPWGAWRGTFSCPWPRSSCPGTCAGTSRRGRRSRRRSVCR